MSKPKLKLKDLKLHLDIECPEHESVKVMQKIFMPTTKVSKVKMMLKRLLKIESTTDITLSYWPIKVIINILHF